MLTKKILRTVGFSVFWVLFFYVWGVIGWRDAALFSAGWWFDTAGHALYGIVGAFTLLHLYKTYSVHGAFYITGRKHLMKDIIADIGIGGILWEGLELLWDWHIQPDYLVWFAKAQKGAADTTIDILVNITGAAIAMLLYYCFDKTYEWLYPNSIEETEIAETIEMLQEVSKRVRRRRREHIKPLRPFLKELISSFKHINRT